MEKRVGPVSIGIRGIRRVQDPLIRLTQQPYQMPGPENSSEDAGLNMQSRRAMEGFSTDSGDGQCRTLAEEIPVCGRGVLPPPLWGILPHRGSVTDNRGVPLTVLHDPWSIVPENRPIADDTVYEHVPASSCLTSGSERVSCGRRCRDSYVVPPRE